jgi:hypothetical protein
MHACTGDRTHQFRSHQLQRTCPPPSPAPPAPPAAPRGATSAPAPGRAAAPPPPLLAPAGPGGRPRVFLLDLAQPAGALRVMRALRPLLEDPGRAKLLHGCANDLSGLRGQWGVEVAGHIDTQVRGPAAAPRAAGRCRAC